VIHHEINFHTPCLEAVADWVETGAFDSFLQTKSEKFSLQSSILLLALI